MTTAEEEFFNRLFWFAPYGECFYCSAKAEPIAATYEVWFTLRGEAVQLWSTEEADHTTCHTLCVKCTAEVRAEPEEGFEQTLIRLLQRRL